MAINRTYGFEGVEGELTLYNGQAVLDLSFEYMALDVNGDEVDYNFPGYASSFLYVYDSEERNTLVKSFTSQLTRNAKYQVLNASVLDMTFDDPGLYWFEMGYVRSGYEVVLRYGDLFIE